MLVALLSDVHDRIAPLTKALQQAGRLGCKHLLFMGDLTSLSTMQTMREAWDYPMELILGNNEPNTGLHLQLAETLPATTHHGTEGSTRISGRNIYFSHYPQPAIRHLITGRYDAVFYGHTHIPSVEQRGQALLANPGEIQGRTGQRTFGIYDTGTNTVRIIKL